MTSQTVLLIFSIIAKSSFIIFICKGKSISNCARILCCMCHLTHMALGRLLGRREKVTMNNYSAVAFPWCSMVLAKPYQNGILIELETPYLCCIHFLLLPKFNFFIINLELFKVPMFVLWKYLSFKLSFENLEFLHLPRYRVSSSLL